MNLTILHGRIGFMGDLVTVGEKQTEKLEFSIATQVRYNNENQTTWHTCAAWGKRAEIIHKHFAKGSEILVSGRYDKNEWTTKDGEKKSRMVLSVNEFDFCGPSNKKQSSEDSQAQSQPPQNSAPDSEAPPPSSDDDLHF